MIQANVCCSPAGAGACMDSCTQRRHSTAWGQRDSRQAKEAPWGHLRQRRSCTSAAYLDCEAQVPGAPLLQNACACRWAIAGQQGQGGQGETERVHPACRLASC